MLLAGNSRHPELCIQNYNCVKVQQLSGKLNLKNYKNMHLLKKTDMSVKKFE